MGSGPWLMLALCASVLQVGLPEGELVESGPQAYRFVCEYQQTDAQDQFIGKQRISATYKRGLPNGRVEWSAVSLASAQELASEYSEPSRTLQYMEGFSYDSRQGYAMFLPAFFSEFPATKASAYAKNLVWDVHMLEQFGRSYFTELILNEPFVVPSGSNSTVPLAGMGSFKNRRIELTWIGCSQWQGEECALIRYEAFFNRFDMRLAGSGIDGLSHYWGMIWVSLEDKQLEYATLNEQVSLAVHREDQQVGHYHVLRVATLTREVSGPPE